MALKSELDLVQSVLHVLLQVSVFLKSLLLQNVLMLQENTVFLLLPMAVFVTLVTLQKLWLSVLHVSWPVHF